MQFPRYVRQPFACLVSGVALALCSAAAPAATIFVTSPVDSVAFGDGCSIREAIINANTDSVSGSFDCAQGDPGNDTIVLGANSVSIYSSLNDENDAATGDLDITSPITILGGAPSLSAVDASFSGRIFDVQNGGELTVDGVRLLHGFESLAGGGAIRVRSGGKLTMSDAVVQNARLDPLQADGKGAGIFLEAFSTTAITRTELSMNEAKGLNAAGAAIYCDGCTLDIAASTFAVNDATYAGAGLYVAPGSFVSLSYVTFGYNLGLLGAGVFTESALTLQGLMAANNGAGMAGDDLSCNGMALAASHSFAGRTDCAATAGLLTRADLGPLFPERVLREYTYQPFVNASSRVLQIESGLDQFAGTIPPAECAGDVDQYGRALPTADPLVPSRGWCSYGAMQLPVIHSELMVQSVNANDDPIPFNVRFAPSVDTWVRLRAIGAAGESCDLPDQTLLFLAGDTIRTFWIDPSTVFQVPVMGRPIRVCEFEAVVESGSGYPGDAAWLGASTGSYYLSVKDNTTALAAGISTPAVGAFLDLGTVPVSTGGESSIWFHPDVGGWNLTGCEISGPDASRFTFDAATCAQTVKDRASGGSRLNIDCLGGTLGEFAAQLVVYTDHETWPALIYGLHCRVAHFLSVGIVNSTVNETATGSAVPTLTLSLDSSNLGSPFDVVVSDLGGSALAGTDYETFAQTVRFETGDPATKTIFIAPRDDQAWEDTENFSLHVAVDPSAGVVQAGVQQTQVTILDDERPGDNLMVTVSGIPSHARAGDQVIAAVTVTNIGSDPVRDRLEGMLIATSVDAPARIISYTLEGASCFIAPDYGRASCPVPRYLGPGETETVHMLIEMAEMVDPPQIDVTGVITASVSAGTGAGNSAEANDEVPFTIVPRTQDSAGGGLGGLYLLLMAFGLAFRQRGFAVAGRKAGPVRRARTPGGHS